MGEALPDRFDHAEPHFNTAVGMVLTRFWEPRHTVVTVSQDLYSETMMFLYVKVSERERKDLQLFFHNFKPDMKAVEKRTEKNLKTCVWMFPVCNLDLFHV